MKEEGKDRQLTLHVVHIHGFNQTRIENVEKSQTPWRPPIIPALRSLRQKDREIEANLHYTVRPCLQKQNRQPNLKKIVYSVHV
jgi:hypothetical protein